MNILEILGCLYIASFAVTIIYIIINYNEKNKNHNKNASKTASQYYQDNGAIPADAFKSDFGPIYARSQERR